MSTFFHAVSSIFERWLSITKSISYY